MSESNKPILSDEATFELTLNAPLYCVETSKEQVSKWHSLRESVLSRSEGSAVKDVQARMELTRNARRISGY
jgi:hypothetical protein